MFLKFKSFDFSKGKLGNQVSYNDKAKVSDLFLKIWPMAILFFKYKGKGNLRIYKGKLDWIFLF